MFNQLTFGQLTKCQPFHRRAYLNNIYLSTLLGELGGHLLDLGLGLLGSFHQHLAVALFLLQLFLKLSNPGANVIKNVFLSSLTMAKLSYNVCPWSIGYSTVSVPTQVEFPSRVDSWVGFSNMNELSFVWVLVPKCHLVSS
jgi:hypothetical protein